MEIKEYDIGHTLGGQGFFKFEDRAEKAHGMETHTTHAHSFYSIYWVHDGSGIHSVDFVDYGIRPGRVFFIRPGQVHFIHPSAKMKYSAIQFSPDLMVHALQHAEHYGDRIMPVTDLDADGQENFQMMFRLIGKESYSNCELKADILQSEIYTLLLFLIRAGINSHESIMTLKEPIRRFVEMVNNDFLDKRQVSDYAATLGLTANYLNVLCQQELHKSALHVINERIVLEIKRRLIDGSKSVSQTAYSLGFNELSYFSRFFKRHTGMTPVEFRNHIFNEYRL